MVRVKFQVPPTGRGALRRQTALATTVDPSRTVQQGAPGAVPVLVTLAWKVVVPAAVPGVVVRAAV